MNTEGKERKDGKEEREGDEKRKEERKGKKGKNERFGGREAMHSLVLCPERLRGERSQEAAPCPSRSVRL
jgi:hypothetical protein